MSNEYPPIGVPYGQPEIIERWRIPLTPSSTSRGRRSRSRLTTKISQLSEWSYSGESNDRSRSYSPDSYHRNRSRSLSSGRSRSYFSRLSSRSRRTRPRRYRQRSSRTRFRSRSRSSRSRSRSRRSRSKRSRNSRRRSYSRDNHCHRSLWSSRSRSRRSRSRTRRSRSKRSRNSRRRSYSRDNHCHRSRSSSRSRSRRSRSRTRRSRSKRSRNSRRRVKNRRRSSPDNHCYRSLSSSRSRSRRSRSRRSRSRRSRRLRPSRTSRIRSRSRSGSRRKRSRRLRKSMRRDSRSTRRHRHRSTFQLLGEDRVYNVQENGLAPALDIVSSEAAYVDESETSSEATTTTTTSIDSSANTLHLLDMGPSDIVAMWNELSIQIAEGNCPNSRTERAYNSNRLKCRDLIQVTTLKLSSFSMEQLSQTIFSIALIASSLLTRYRYSASHEGDLDLEASFRNLLLKRNMKEEIFNLVACEAVDKLHQSDGHNLSNLAYAYASIGFMPSLDDEQDFLEIIATKVVEFNSGYNAQDISLMLRAYVTTSNSNPSLLKLRQFGWFLADHVVAFVDELHPQMLSETVWIFSELGLYRKKLFQRLADRIVGLAIASDILARYTPRDLSIMARAYANFKCHKLELFKLVASAAIRLKDDFNSHHVTNLLWAFATMGAEEQIFVSFAPIVMALLDTATINHISIIAWSYAIMNVDAPGLFNSHFINQVTLKCKHTSVDKKILSRLHQWNLWQTKEKMRPGLQSRLQNKCYGAFISGEIHSSALQSEVISILSSIGIVPEEEVLMGSGYSIDALVAVDGKTIGIEVDGPSHFICESRSPLGSTILKRRQVQSIDGIELISLTHWDWRKIKSSTAKKQKLLCDMLGLENLNICLDTLKAEASKGRAKVEEESVLVPKKD